MPIRTSFVIGNGESRKDIDLESCKKRGLTVGCNAIVRDFEPHIVSAADQRMVEQIINSKYFGKIYTRPDWNVKLMVDEYPQLPYEGKDRFDNPWHWNSGPHAVNIACQSKHAGWFGKKTNLCFLLGFDLKQSDNPNNIYKNTQGYDNKVVDPTHWHYQLNKLFQCYSEVSFVWVVPDDFVCPKEWVDNDNFFRENITQFSKFIKDYSADHKLVDNFQAQ